MRTKVRTSAASAMRTTLELPDPLFARLKARAAHEQVTLKQLLRSYVEQGLNTTPPAAAAQRTADSLPQLHSSLSIPSHNLSNATLFEMLDA
jgi:predicted DNA-binding ribbon-helix-helix protein